MPRIALGLEYCGTEFRGWQRQPDLPSVQETLETAISAIVQHPVEVVAAGRTDRGVHAVGMVAHFDTEAEHPETAFVFGVNRFLPSSIKVHWAQYVDEEFHARFKAVYRRYQYVILNTSTASPLLHERVFWHPIPLDAALMQQAADLLVGEHDFTSVRGKDCQARTPVKKVHFCKVTRERDLIIIDIQADGFLHHMVRNITGVLLKIGEGRQPVSWINEVLAAKTRTAAGMNVPGCGLYFCEVGYPENFGLVKRQGCVPFL
jgi:tRNA pseudouridine38-40 synthase